MCFSDLTERSRVPIIVIVLPLLASAIIVCAVACTIRKICKRRRLRQMADDESVTEFRMPLRKLDWTQNKLWRVFLFLKACVLIAVMMRRKLGQMLSNLLTNQPPPPDQRRHRRPRAPRIQPAQNLQQDNCQTPRRSGRIRRPPVRLNYDRWCSKKVVFSLSRRLFLNSDNCLCNWRS